MRPHIGNQEFSLIKKVLESKTLTEGNFTKAFEKKIQNYVGAKHAIATTSATTALHTVLTCYKIKGKKVLVSDFTFPATADAISMAGGIPVLVDVDLETMNVSYEIIENALGKNIDIVLPVSLFGNPVEKKFYTLRKRGIKIVEDAATNLGTKLEDKYVGTLADATCFSFHPRKIITTGEGGMITTNDNTLAEKCRAFKNFGKKDNRFIGLGTNYKLSDILSAIGLAQMHKIKKIIKKRRSLAQNYVELLSKINNIEIQKPVKHSKHTYQSFVCYITKPNKRDRIIKELAKNNIESQIGTYALHCLPAFKNSIKKGNLTNSEFLYRNSISLPLHEELTYEDQQLICKIIKKMI